MTFYFFYDIYIMSLNVSFEAPSENGSGYGLFFFPIVTESGTMSVGTVKWFNNTKGYGFICPEDGSKDVFVHISAVQKAGIRGLKDGQKVEYELVPGRDGRSSAENLKIVE